MSRLIDLRQKRGAVLKEARELNSLAARERRDFTAEELRKYEAKLDEFEKLGEQIDREQDLERRELGLNELADVQVDQNSHPQQRRSEWAGALRDDATGHALRAYRHEERIGQTQTDNPNELGMMCLDHITGSRDLAPERRAALQADNESKGGILLSVEGAGRVWDMARAASVVSAAGAVTVPVPRREMTIGKITADPAAAWVPERGNIDLDDDMLFGAVNVRLRKLALRIEITDEMLMFANASQLITQACSTALAQEMDRAALAGTGAGEEPLGILNTTGILTSAASPVAISLDQMLDVYTALQAANVQPNSFVVHPTMAGNISKIKDGAGQYFATLPGDLQGVRKHVTSKMTSTVFLMGDFSNLLLLPNSRGIEIDLVKDVVSGRGCWLLQLIAYFDTACVWPGRFYSLTGVTG